MIEWWDRTAVQMNVISSSFSVPARGISHDKLDVVGVNHRARLIIVAFCGVVFLGAASSRSSLARCETALSVADELKTRARD